jgi:hypothetical protein
VTFLAFLSPLVFFAMMASSYAELARRVLRRIQ